MRQKYSVSIWHKTDMGNWVNLRIERLKFRFWLFARIYKLWASYHNDTVYMSYIPLYSIETDSGVSYQDSGRWRSYQLETAGDTLEELVQNATVSEIDQDGGDLNTYSLDEACTEVEQACLKIIHSEVSK